MKKGMMKSKNAVMFITLGILVVAIVIIAVIGSLAGGGQESLPAVQTIPVTKGDVTQEVDATGNVESEQKKTFYISGKRGNPDNACGNRRQCRGGTEYYQL